MDACPLVAEFRDSGDMSLFVFFFVFVGRSFWNDDLIAIQQVFG